MKIYIYVYILGALLLSCNNSFLERLPTDEISNQSFWNSENDLRVYNNSLYDLARDDKNVPIMVGHDDDFDSYRISRWYLDEYSDNMAPIAPRHNFYQAVKTGHQNVPSNPQYYGYSGWNFVRAINFGLQNYNSVDVAESIKNKYIAEARLFRGWFYAEKVQKFGDVQWIETPLNIDSDKLFGSRDERNFVMEKVLEDLNYAVSNLPDNWNDGNAPGRLNRWCALLVKSRVCLFEGTWRKYRKMPNAEAWLKEAAAAAQEVINKGPYSLYSTGNPESDFNQYMRILDLAGNPEVMYWRKYKMGIAVNHVQSYFGSYNGGGTKSLVESFLCKDGLPISQSPLYQGDESIEDVFENRDPRLHQTILRPGDETKYNYHLGDGRDYPRIRGMEGGLKTSTGYHIIKFYNADDMIGHAWNTGESPAIILRFAEVLLNFAEAKAELGELTQADLDISINLLRNRVDMPNLKMENVPVDKQAFDDGIDPLIYEIRRERRVELAIEGFRYKDLKRWKQGKKLTIPTMGIRWTEDSPNRYKGATIETIQDPVTGFDYIDVYAGTDWANPVFDESKHYLWPIPLSVIAQNSNIAQNPGW